MDVKQQLVSDSLAADVAGAARARRTGPMAVAWLWGMRETQELMRVVELPACGCRTALSTTLQRALQGRWPPVSQDEAGAHREDGEDGVRGLAEMDQVAPDLAAAGVAGLPGLCCCGGRHPAAHPGDQYSPARVAAVRSPGLSGFVFGPDFCICHTQCVAFKCHKRVTFQGLRPKTETVPGKHHRVARTKNEIEDPVLPV